MKALFNGCFSFISMAFALVFFIQYPVVFWIVIAIFAVVIILGFRAGLRQRDAKTKSLGAKPAVTDDEEGDLRHHYNHGGTLLGIDNPDTIQNQSTSFDDEEEHH
jgi:hypothetical protein